MRRLCFLFGLVCVGGVGGGGRLEEGGWLETRRGWAALCGSPRGGRSTGGWVRVRQWAERRWAMAVADAGLVRAGGRPRRIEEWGRREQHRRWRRVGTCGSRGGAAWGWCVGASLAATLCQRRRPTAAAGAARRVASHPHRRPPRDRVNWRRWRRVGEPHQPRPPRHPLPSPTARSAAPSRGAAGASRPASRRVHPPGQVQPRPTRQPQRQDHPPPVVAPAPLSAPRFPRVAGQPPAAAPPILPHPCAERMGVPASHPPPAVWTYSISILGG